MVLIFKLILTILQTLVTLLDQIITQSNGDFHELELFIVA